MNSLAMQKLPLVVNRHLARMASDHYPIVIKMDERMRPKVKTIKFEDTWWSYPAAKSIVYHSWKKNDVGDEYTILKKKLNRTLKSLFFWNKNKCKDLNVLKERLKKKILDLQNKEALNSNWSVDDVFELRNKVHELNITVRRLSTWWNQRAKARWHEEGDANSKLFHNFATARRNGNRIFQVKDEANKLQEEEDQIEKKLTDAYMELLNAEFTEKEMQILMFQQGNNKSPGLDGITSSFYKCYWNIVWETLWNSVRCFFNSSHMNKEWKDTLIVLIPKIKNPLTPSNYRPISLCQTNYKIGTTMLVNRLKKGISNLISEDLATFIHERSIAEHYLLAQEIFHKFKISKNKKGMMAVKLDMEQAYDSMGWTTLRHILRWYGFPTVFSNLLLECVVDVRFSVIINGKNSEWINAQSGFRQGCPLSPYLFIMCFQLITNSLEQRGKSLGIQISSEGPKITHLLYVDDALIFSHASVELAKTLKTVVEKFCKWTGQKINVSKSQLLFGKVVSYHMRKKIGRILGFKIVKEMKYLGVKISLERIKMADYQEIPSNAMERLNAWSRKSLSLGDGTKGMHYIAWNDICKPRSLGGLGLHSPLHRIGSLRSKVTWNYIQKPYSLLHRVMKRKYGDNVMNGAQRNISSNAWKILVDGGNNLRMVVRWNVGKGDKINILNDTWLLDRCINRWPTFEDCNFLDDNALYPRGCKANETYEHIMKMFVQNSGIVRVYCSIHGKSAMPCSIVAANALFFAVSKSGPFLSSWGTNLLRESQRTWYPPLKEWIKVNVDASLTSSNLAGIGGIFRDYKGRFISAFGKNGNHWDIGHLELQAVLMFPPFILMPDRVTVPPFPYCPDGNSDVKKINSIHYSDTTTKDGNSFNILAYLEGEEDIMGSKSGSIVAEAEAEVEEGELIEVQVVETEAMAFCPEHMGKDLAEVNVILKDQGGSDLAAEGNNLGIKVAPLAPKIFHLMYADDMLILSEADNEEVKLIQQILKGYVAGWDSSLKKEPRAWERKSRVLRGFSGKFVAEFLHVSRFVLREDLRSRRFWCQRTRLLCHTGESESD
ncbi:hypothetical protein KFK09_026461 [Dendrobium nobile]|uniref:Reverse transcriptase domain-containing protein n=1 Tax=Dendrobium nobile TaxID=94219 RepID=A0A8T3A877_DENNO|nr:hypothetical protein KFK09_026461 [Dendrobium nobile]